MKLLNYLSVVASLGLAACNVHSDTDAETARRAQEDQRIAAFLETSGKTATKTTSGIYKVEISPGTGSNATGTDIIEISMQLNTFSGSPFFSDTAYVVTASNGLYLPKVTGSIDGLVESALLLNKGESAEFYIPSYLFFGPSTGYYNNVLIEPNETIDALMKLKAIRTGDQQKTYEDQVIASILSDSTGFARTPDGVYKKVLVEGSGTDMPSSTSSVNITYTGTLLDGTKFDSGTSAEFKPENMIPGLAEILQTMKKGETALIFVPSQLAYGPAGSVDSSSGFQDIPAFATLYFVITLNNF